MQSLDKDMLLPAAADARQVEQAIWGNMFAHYLSFGTIPGGAYHDAPDLKWAYVGKPLFFNRIFGARFAVEDAEERVFQVTEQVKSWASPVTWLIDPLGSPENLGSILERNGWTNPRGVGQPLPTWAGMAMELSTLATDIDVPPGVTFSRLANADDIDRWVPGFFSKAPSTMFEEILAVFSALGCGDHLPWELYVASLDGEPVASSLLYFGAGVAGVYWVGTVPAARRQGIGTAITWHTLVQARQMGYHWAILQATDMGAPVYRRLGFKAYGSLAYMIYTPE